MYGELTSDHYTAATGVSKSAYEERLLQAARRALESGSLDGVVESVTLTSDVDQAHVAVRFRVPRLPGRRFRWRTSVWPVSPPDDEVAGTPESHASLLPVHLDEAINEIPTCANAPSDADGVEWIDWTTDFT
jgi:hypothetical protein